MLSPKVPKGLLLLYYCDYSILLHLHVERQTILQLVRTNSSCLAIAIKINLFFFFLKKNALFLRAQKGWRYFLILSMADATSLFPNQVMTDMDPTVQSDTVLVGASFVLSSDRL